MEEQQTGNAYPHPCHSFQITLAIPIHVLHIQSIGFALYLSLLVLIHHDLRQGTPGRMRQTLDNPQNPVAGWRFVVVAGTFPHFVMECILRPTPS